MKTPARLLFCSLVAAVLFPACAVTANALEPASVFSDHMVLQREAPVPVWGTAEAGDRVTVTFAGQTVATETAAGGTWRLDLKPLATSSEPRVMKIVSEASPKPVEIQNVLVGDVWVGSGQSNMAGKVAAYAKNDPKLAALQEKGSFPTIRLLQGWPKPSWVEATADTVPKSSALLFSFGERLNRELEVPVGLIFDAVGGTPSGLWIPEETWTTSERCRAAIEEFAKTYDGEGARAEYEAQVEAWKKRAEEAKAKGETLKVPKLRPPVNPGESIRGGKIGGLYARFLSTVAGYRIRGVLWDQGESKSGVLGVDQHTMMSELIRGWREAWGQGDYPFLFVQKPSGGGCAWPGENPVTAKADAFGALPDITKIGNGEMAHLYVRLMRDNANAWMVPAGDLGSGVHPPNKWGYGQRAAEVALQKAYDADVQAYGPRYRSHRIEGGEVIVEFDEVGKGLAVAHGDTLQGFAVAGEDGQWHWADARIEGDKVIASSVAVPAPRKIRYAWAQKHGWANLFNRDGLPALVFEASNLSISF